MQVHFNVSRSDDTSLFEERVVFRKEVNFELDLNHQLSKTFIDSLPTLEEFTDSLPLSSVSISKCAMEMMLWSDFAQLEVGSGGTGGLGIILAQ